MNGVERDVMFVALTRPQMLAGVTYSYFVANAVLATELFLIFHTLWALVIALVVHVAGMMLCRREPRFLDLWLNRLGRCPAVPHFLLCPCKSYRPQPLPPEPCPRRR